MTAEAIDRTERIEGAKGGGTPTEASDTLRSTQRADIVDMLGEGHIAGLVSGLKSVYLDGVPVENADGSKNFKDFAFHIARGGPTDTAPAEGFGDVETEVGVGVTVLAAVPVVRTIADSTVSSVRVTITVPQLVEAKENGDRVGSGFEWAIDVQSNGGGYVQKHHDTISGKASAPYTRSVKVDLATAGPPPWNVRVRRISADSITVNIVNAFGWSSYTAISGVRMLYRNSAVAWMTFDAQNFSATPNRAFDVMGIDDWDIPVNYDGVARSYGGTWNGVFKQGWTNNPAWVFYNLVQHPRYGLGQYITQLPDKWVLYKLAQWCDAAVPDGRGGTEPRYTINASLMQQAEALRLLQDVCAVFRGAVMYSGATLGATWDAPGVKKAIYGPANVVGGLFTYSDGSRASKKSSCTCWYNDRSQFGKRMPATWDEPSLVAKYGLRRMEIDPVGVASPGQALRMAKWALFTTELEDATVAFKVGSQGTVAGLGEIFEVNDPSETGERLAGRVRAATTTQVTLDAPVVLLAGETYLLKVTLADPDDSAKLITEERTVTNGEGTHSLLTVAAAFSAAPMVQTMWLLEGSEVAPTLWRYVSIQEARNGENNELEYEIVGLRHVPGKWDLIELNQPLTPRPTRRLSDAAPRVTGLAISETNFVDGAVERIRATVTWTMPAQGLRYLVTWRLSSGTWNALPAATSNTVEVSDLQPGLFEVRVQSQNVLGSTSVPVEASIVLTGPTSVPPDVAGLSAVAVSAGIEVRWTPYTAGNAGETEVRYGADWDSGTLLFRGRASTYTAVAPPPATYTLWARHYDISGERQSANASSVTIIWDGINLFSVLTLSASSQLFKVDTAGAATPTSITLTAGGQNLAGSPVWVVTIGTATLGGASGSPTRTLAFANMLTDMVEIQVTWDGQVDRVSIFKLKDGSDSYSWGLVNESQSVPCDSAGTPLVTVNLASQMVVVKGATVLTSGVAYSVLSSSGLESVGTSFGPTANVTIHPTTGVISVTKITSDLAEATFRASVGGTNLDRTLSVSKVRQGTPGTKAPLVTLSASPQQMFSTTAAGVISPSSITVSASVVNFTSPTYQWFIDGAIQGSTGSFLTLSSAGFAAPVSKLIKVVVIGGAGESGLDTMTITSLKDGSDAISVILSNEAALVAADVNGNVASFVGAATTIKVFRGATDVTAAATITKADTSITTTLAGVGTSNVTLTPSAMSADTGRSDLTVTLAPYPAVPKLYSLGKVKVGQTGGVGGQGNTGQSNHRIYKAAPYASPPATPGNTTNGAVPAGWSASPVSIAVGEAQFQSDGTTPAGSTTTTWAAPYQSYLKVGQLSAITADIGNITAGTLTGTVIRTAVSGARIAINEAGSNAIIGYMPGGVEMFRLNAGAGIVTITSDQVSPSSGALRVDTSAFTGCAISAFGPAGVPAIRGVANSSGTGVKGESGGSGEGVWGTSVSGPGGRFSSLRIDLATVPSGANAATFTGLLPSGSPASPNVWGRVNRNGIEFWEPLWPV